MRMSRILRLHRPVRGAVKKQFVKNIGTAHGKVFAAVTSLAALAMAVALIWPHSAAVRFFSVFGLSCFLPVLSLLLLRRWNRTLAYPGALLFSGVAATAMIANFNYDNFWSNLFATLLLCTTFLIGATSDRLSFIYKWSPPFDSAGLVAASVFLYFIVYFAFMFFAIGMLTVILCIALMMLVIRGFFGRRRGRWF